MTPTTGGNELPGIVIVVEYERRSLVRSQVSRAISDVSLKGVVYGVNVHSETHDVSML